MDQDPRSSKSKRIVVAAAAVGALIGAGGIAGAITAQQSGTDTTTSVAVQDSTAPVDDTGVVDEVDEVDEADEADEADEHMVDEHMGTEELLTGTLAEQVTAAAQAAVPGGTIVRVETDANGAVYEAHMTDADGNEVTVTFDADLAVVDTVTGHGGGHGGREKGDGHDEAALTGIVADQVTAAAQAAVPGGTVTEVEAENHDGVAYEAHVTDADDNEVEVTFDADFAVVAIEQGH